MELAPEPNSTVISSDDSTITDVVKFPLPLTMFAAISAVIFSVVGVSGNLLTILALTKDVKLRKKATTSFIISLAVSDFMFCGINLPLTAVRYFYQKWVLGDQLCRVFPFFFYGNVAASLMSMVAITINRYVIIGCFKYYAKIYTPRNVYLMIAALWIFSFGMIFPPLVDKWGTLGLDESTFSCTIKKLEGKSPKKFLFLVAFLLPTVVIISCYSAIFYKIKTMRRKMESHSFRTPVSASKIRIQNQHKKHRKEDIKLTKMMLTIFILFLVCFLPLMLVNVVDDDMKMPSIHVVASVLAWMSASINPFVYAIQNQQYQEAFRSLLCKKRSNEEANRWGGRSQDDPIPNKSEMLCPCLQRGSLTPNITPTSSKVSINTLSVELKSIKNLQMIDHLQIYPTEFCDNH